jgi:hypothetical protein
MTAKVTPKTQQIRLRLSEMRDDIRSSNHGIVIGVKQDRGLAQLAETL